MQEAYDNEVTEALARGLPITYATTLRTFVNDISSISRGYEAWVLKAQRSTSQILFRRLRGAKM
eukprot:4130501-Karenia_brevis.AAC.1